MKKSILCILFTLLMQFFIYKNVSATHAMGGELIYKWITGNTYEFTYSFYRDCFGINAPPEVQLISYPFGCGDSAVYPLTLLSVEAISSVCNGYQTFCFGGYYFGYERYTYFGTVTLPFTCEDWKFSVTESARNTAITNLENAGFYGLYVESKLDNVNTPFNNSPVFTNAPVATLFINQTYHVNNGAIDPDGDSLVFSLANPLNEYGMPITYVFPFTPINPMSSSTPITLDPVSGDFTITPNLMQVGVVSYLVDEYRNGVFIGSTTRDIQLIVQTGNDALPLLSGIDNTTSYQTFIEADSTLQFTIYSSDPDAGQELSIGWDNSYGQVTIDSSGIFPIALFTWTPTVNDVRPYPYIITFTVSDDACPYKGIQTYSYQVYVKHDNTNDVWPGDADADFIVTMYDILPIGIAYGTSGDIRPLASLDWVAQPCPDWSQTFSGSMNYKHADCDGNGLVDAPDFDVITLNYGLFHLKPGPSATREGAPLFLDMSNSQAGGGNYSIPMQFGNSLVSLDDVYGLTFTLNVDPTFITPGTLSIDNSDTWLGNSNDLKQLMMNFSADGAIDAGMVRLDQQGVSGFGTIGYLNFSTTVQDPEWLHISFSNVKAIDLNGQEILVSPVEDSIQIDNTVSSGQLSPNQSFFTIYPNPSTGEFYLTLLPDRSGAIKIEVIDILGRVLNSVYEDINHGVKKIIKIDLSSFDPGSYSVRVQGEHFFSEKKIMLANGS